MEILKNVSAFLFGIVLPLAVPLALFLAWQLVTILRMRGYRTTYAEALLRAVGAGANAAKDAGTTIFAPQGRMIALNAAIDYMQATVPTASAKLGIAQGDHAQRIDGQIGAMELQSEVNKGGFSDHGDKTSNPP